MKAGKHRKARSEIRDYDDRDTTGMIDPSKPLGLEDVGLRLPETPSTQVISIRLPSTLLNRIRAFASERDIPYHATIKLFLAESLDRHEKRIA